MWIEIFYDYIIILMTVRANFFLDFLLLLGCIHALDWQGIGNMSGSNMTIIKNYIDANFSSSWKQTTVTNYKDTTLVNFSISFSDHLNSLWDPAWNVVVVYLYGSTNYDSLVYGYAFRGHWIWLNGYAMIDGNYVTFIIWKDYNCVSWITLNYGWYSQPNTSWGDSTTLAIKTILTHYLAVMKKEEIWLSASGFIPLFMASDPNLSGDKAYTIIMSQ